jgi:hypothetical protein
MQSYHQVVLSTFGEDGVRERQDHPMDLLPRAIVTGAAARGTSPEAYRTELQAQVERTVPRLHPWVRMTGQSLAGALRDGRWKTQHEIQSSGGTYSPSNRRSLERSLFGYDEESTPHHERPVYGYLTDHADGESPSGPMRRDGASQYGGVAVRLKRQSVAHHTTWTGEDSFGHSLNGFVPSLYLRPSYRSLPAEEVATSGHDASSSRFEDLPGHVFGYVEAQYHGGLHPEHVAEVVFHQGHELPHAREELDRLGIPYRMARGMDRGRPT